MLNRDTSFWKALMKSPFRMGFAFGGLVSIATLALREKYRGRVNEDEAVEDFTLLQQAMLKRVREIWEEHSRLPIDPQAPPPRSSAASMG
jgi:hypothetical protein